MRFLGIGIMALLLWIRVFVIGALRRRKGRRRFDVNMQAGTVQVTVGPRQEIFSLPLQSEQEDKSGQERQTPKVVREPILRLLVLTAQGPHNYGTAPR